MKLIKRAIITGALVGAMLCIENEDNKKKLNKENKKEK